MAPSGEGATRGPVLLLLSLLQVLFFQAVAAPAAVRERKEVGGSICSPRNGADMVYLRASRSGLYNQGDATVKVVCPIAQDAQNYVYQPEYLDKMWVTVWFFTGDNANFARSCTLWDRDGAKTITSTFPWPFTSFEMTWRDAGFAVGNQTHMRVECDLPPGFWLLHISLSEPVATDAD